MSSPARLACCSVVVAALLGCGSTVVLAPPGADSGSPPIDAIATDRGSSPVDAGTPPIDRVTPVVDVLPGADVPPRVCILSNGVRCPAGQACSDGCNTCFCPTDGGPVGCTTRACLDAGPRTCRSRTDCRADEQCNFREAGCGVTGVCGAITDCAAIRPYCGCDGETFRDCPGSVSRPYTREGDCGTTVDAGAPFDSAICGGASIGRGGGYCAGPADGPLPLECCRGWDCDDRAVMCAGRPDPCPPGHVHLITLGCWGSCVPATHCLTVRCNRGFCPHGFTCDDADNCVPVKID